MIALLAAAASAAPAVDVLLAPTAVRTAPVLARHESLDVLGAPIERSLEAERGGFDGRGLSVAVLHDRRPDLLFVEAGFRVETPRWQVRGFTFAPTATAIHLDVGALSWFRGRRAPAVDGYGLGAAGIQVSTLGAEPFATAVAPALHGIGGLGIGNREGAVRLRAEVRAELALRIDRLEGHAELPNGTFVWSWWPGEAGLSLVVGIGIPGRSGE